MPYLVFIPPSVLAKTRSQSLGQYFQYSGSRSITTVRLAGLPSSGKILTFWKVREFQYFCRESVKARENDLDEETQSFSLISRHIFVKLQWLQVQNFSLLRSGFQAIPIRSVSGGRGKSGKSAPKKSGNSNQTDWWQPC